MQTDTGTANLETPFYINIIITHAAKSMILLQTTHVRTQIHVAAKTQRDANDSAYMNYLLAPELLVVELLA